MNEQMERTSEAKPSHNNEVDLSILGTYEGADEALSFLRFARFMEELPADWSAGVEGERLDFDAASSCLQRIKDEHFLGFSNGRNLWQGFGFLSSNEKLAIAEALRAAGKPIRREQIERLRDQARPIFEVKHEPSRVGVVASEAKISFPAPAFLGTVEKMERPSRSRVGLGRSLLLLAGFSLAVKGADLVYDSQKLLSLIDAFAQIDKEKQSQVYSNKQAKGGSLGKQPLAIPTPTQVFEEESWETGQSFEFEGIRFDVAHEIGRIRFSVDQSAGDFEDIPSLSFIPNPLPPERNIDRECYEEGTGRGCTYEFDNTIVVAVHTGYSNRGTGKNPDTEKLEVEDWRGFIEGEEGYVRLSPEEQRDNIIKFMSAFWNLEQFGGVVADLSVLWVQRVPVDRVDEFDSNIEALYDFFPEKVRDELVGVEGKKIAVVFCGRYTPGEAEPGTQPAYSWSRFVVVFGRAN